MLNGIVTVCMWSGDKPPREFNQFIARVELDPKKKCYFTIFAKHGDMEDKGPELLPMIISRTVRDELELMLKTGQLVLAGDKKDG